MAEKGVTERELEDAKSYLTGSLLLQLTSTKAIANTMNGLQRDGFDAEYVNHQNDKVRAVTQEDIQRVATKLLKTDQLTTVLVGNPTGITPNITLDKPPGMEE